MDCPQCGTALTTYALEGHEAPVCERCGYVGIDADHRGTPRRVESWHDALRRFYEAADVDGDPHVPVRPDGRSVTSEGGSEDDPGAESDAPAPRPAPDGRPAVRRVEPEGEEAGTDADGSAVDDGVES